MADQSALYDPRLTSALVGAGVVAIGWLVTAARERGRARRLRAERSIDVQTALKAEIEHYVDSLDSDVFDLNEVWEDVVTRMDADKNYVPLIPTEKNDTVFQACLPDIQILPEQVIQPVVRYYNQVFAIEAMIDDLRSDQFRSESVPQKQRIAVYTDYISLKLEALSLGKEACASLQKSLYQTKALRTGLLSNLGVDPSVQR